MCVARKGTERLWKGREHRFKVQDLFADERRSQAVLDFLSTADVKRRVQDPAVEDAQSEASAWELRERQDKEEERRLETEEVEAEVEERLLFLPTRPLSLRKEQGVAFLWSFLVFPLLPPWYALQLGIGWGGGQEEPQRAVRTSGWESEECIAMICD